MDVTDTYPDFCVDKADGNYAHPTDPSKMISCVAQHYAYERHRPEGMEFDENGREI